MTQITQRMLRRVFLGIKLIEGTMGLALHWAIGVGNGNKLIWMRLDSVDTKKAIFVNPPLTATMPALGATGLPNF